ncbi:MAG: response regulator [Desulfosoma sp.]
MSEKVLLVDDETDFLEVMAERMKAREIRVKTAPSAREALSLIEHESFDAVILDLQMPEMNGIEALKVMKSKNPDIQVIVLTGHATVQKGIEAMKLGASDVLEKPADVKVLADKIRKAHVEKMVLVEKKTEEKIRNILRQKGW